MTDFIITSWRHLATPRNLSPDRYSLEQNIEMISLKDEIPWQEKFTEGFKIVSFVFHIFRSINLFSVVYWTAPMDYLFIHFIPLQPDSRMHMRICDRRAKSSHPLEVMVSLILSARDSLCSTQPRLPM